MTTSHSRLNDILFIALVLATTNAFPIFASASEFDAELISLGEKTLLYTGDFKKKDDQNQHYPPALQTIFSIAKAYRFDCGKCNYIDSDESSQIARRVQVLTMVAERLIRDDQTSIVRDLLYVPELPANSIIKSGLEYLAHLSPDVLIEKNETPKATQARVEDVLHALTAGATLATQLGDSGATQFYHQKRNELHTVLTNLQCGPKLRNL